MHNQPVILSSFDHADLPVVQEWFCDPETRRFLGGPDWPALMLERAERGLGRVFRGAVQTGAYRYLARSGGRAMGYVGLRHVRSLYGLWARGDRRTDRG